MNIFNVDTMMVLAAIFGGFIWMNGKFNELEKDVLVIKTVLAMKNIMTNEIVPNKKGEEPPHTP
jgi:predicted nucleic acid-binding protein